MSDMEDQGIATALKPPFGDGQGRLPAGHVPEDREQLLHAGPGPGREQEPALGIRGLPALARGRLQGRKPRDPRARGELGRLPRQAPVGELRRPNGRHADQGRAPAATRKKPTYPVSPGLRGYLRTYKRERDLPVTYERLRGFSEVVPLTDADGKPTLWDTVIYDGEEMRALNEALKEVYAVLKVNGDMSVVQHLYADRVDFCTFGNSMPFRIRIVNAYNDNQDYFYVKKADASRIYGLELEHLLSPNRLNFLTHGGHAHRGARRGDPWGHLHQELAQPPRAQPYPGRQGAGEVQRALLRQAPRRHALLQFRVCRHAGLRGRAGAHQGDGLRPAELQRPAATSTGPSSSRRTPRSPSTASRSSTWRPRTSTCARSRRSCSSARSLRPAALGLLLDDMERDPISPPEKVHQLRESLAEHYGRPEYRSCESMGALVRENLESIRRHVGRPALSELVPHIR